MVVVVVVAAAVFIKVVMVVQFYNDERDIAALAARVDRPHARMPRNGVLNIRGRELGQPGELHEVIAAAAEDPARRVVREDPRGVELVGRDRIPVPKDVEAALKQLTLRVAVEVQLVEVVGAGDGLETGPGLGDEVEGVPGGGVCGFEGRLGPCLSGADYGVKVGESTEDVAHGLIQPATGEHDEIETLEDREGRFVAGEILDEGWRGEEAGDAVLLYYLHNVLNIERKDHVGGECDHDGAVESCEEER